MTIELVAGDTGSKLVVTCRDNSNGAVIPLNGATVRLKWKGVPSKLMTITNAAGGVAEYQFAAGEIIYGPQVSLVEGVLASPMNFAVEITDAFGSLISNLKPIELWVREAIT